MSQDRADGNPKQQSNNLQLPLKDSMVLPGPWMSFLCWDMSHIILGYTRQKVGHPGSRLGFPSNALHVVACCFFFVIVITPTNSGANVDL